MNISKFYTTVFFVALLYIIFIIMLKVYISRKVRLTKMFDLKYFNTTYYRPLYVLDDTHLILTGTQQMPPHCSPLADTHL
jgi:hypothetical protein